MQRHRVERYGLGSSGSNESGNPGADGGGSGNAVGRGNPGLPSGGTPSSGRTGSEKDPIGSM